MRQCDGGISTLPHKTDGTTGTGILTVIYTRKTLIVSVTVAEERDGDPLTQDLKTEGHLV